MLHYLPASFFGVPINVKCVSYYIPVSHDMMRQTNDCLPVRVMQHKVVDPALGPAALGLGRPGALPAGLVQPCPKPRALIHKPDTKKYLQVRRPHNMG